MPDTTPRRREKPTTIIGDFKYPLSKIGNKKIWQKYQWRQRYKIYY